MLESLHREDSRFVTIGRPPDWEMLSVPPSADLLLAAPAGAGTRFRPNVVINSFPYTGSLAKLSTVVLSHTHTMVKNPYFISVDQFPPDRGQGRIIEYTHTAGDLAVHCRVFALQAEDHAVLITASCAAGELSAYDDALDLVCLSVNLKQAQ